MNKTPAVIFDIDGVLADCTHRLEYIRQEPKDWDKFFSECKYDALIPGMLAIHSALKTMYPILYVTGRPERTRGDTVEWLSRGISPLASLLWKQSFKEEVSSRLFMRRDGDRRHDYQVKRDLYENLIKDYYEVVAVFEDRKTCVNMWRELGLLCLQNVDGDF